MPRVIGIDPGTVSLDICGLDNGRVFLDETIPTGDALADPALVLSRIDSASPLDLVVGPSGYGLPLTNARDLTESDIRLACLAPRGDSGGIGDPSFLLLNFGGETGRLVRLDHRLRCLLAGGRIGLRCARCARGHVGFLSSDRGADLRRRQRYGRHSRLGLHVRCGALSLASDGCQPLRLARRGNDVPANVLTSIEKAEREATTLAEAVAALLAFARPMSIERHPVDLYEIACDVAERASTDDVRVACKGEHTMIEGDAALLRTAIENLVRNAIDAVREKGEGDVRVTIASTPSPTIHVRDTGIGIDPNEVARLLLPFQSRKTHGHGLGLPLAKKIAFLHGGTLRLTGAPNEGATATIEFLTSGAAGSQPAG